ncbi:MAG: GNAT family N-acetyltransferase [Bacteroidales bacterium]
MRFDRVSIELKSIESHLYSRFQDLYGRSFPIFEQRTNEQQRAAFESEYYNLSIYSEEGVFVGFISYWQFEDYRYIEHFAIDDQLRGKGYGTKLLKSFVASDSRQVILEIDPIVDNLSAARLRFYESCGFCINSYQHTHPPYREGYDPHSLVILSSFEMVCKDRYSRFVLDLEGIVMAF